MLTKFSKFLKFTKFLTSHLICGYLFEYPQWL